jgi:hypothetical protein
MNSPVIIWVLVLVMDGDISEHKFTHTREECLSIGRMILSDPETPFDGFFCDRDPPEPVAQEPPVCTGPVDSCS